MPGLTPESTIKRSVALSGVGVHSNARAQIKLHPAPASTGIVFECSGAPRPVAAALSNVVDSTLRTALGDGAGANVGTVEHLLSACAGLRLDNLRVEIQGPELPAFDGSAAAFADAIDEAGLVELPSSRRTLRVLKHVCVRHGHAFAEFVPAERGLTLDIEIDFADLVIGRQRKILTLDPGTFRRELARARSFVTLRRCKRADWPSAPRSKTPSRFLRMRCSTPMVCAFPTNASATKCSMRWATSRLPVRRLPASSAPIAAAMR
jgi:UDP-3-O-[3-hydroxymyristoyl] N-acetylglucosamine deacetylase